MAYVQLRGVDALFAELTARGVATASDPADRPYGMRDFELVDPFGNRIAFGEPAGGAEAPDVHRHHEMTVFGAKMIGDLDKTDLRPSDFEG